MYNTCNWACAQSDQMIEYNRPIFGIEAKTVAKISKLWCKGLQGKHSNLLGPFLSYAEN